MNRFVAADFFLLRTPNFSGKDLLNLYENFDEELKTALKSNSFLNSILLASPSFYSRVKDWMDKPVIHKFDKIKFGLALYYLRSRYRCTPFGTFSGISFGTISNQSSGILESFESKDHFFLDNYFIFGIYEKIINDHNYIENSIISVNSTLHSYKDVGRYIEKTMESGKVRYILSSIKKSEMISIVLELANKEIKFLDLCRNIKKLSESLLMEDIKSFIFELCKNKVLIPKLLFPVTTSSIESYLMDNLKYLPEDESQLIRETINEISLLNPDNSYESTVYNVYKNLKIINKSIKNKDIIQVNQYKHSSYVNINSTFSNKICSSITNFYELFSESNSKFTSFKSIFQERYEGAFVSLLEVLDEENGINFGNDGYIESEILENIPIFLSSANSKFKNINLTNFEQFLCGKLTNSKSEIILSKKEVNKLKEKNITNGKVNWPSDISVIGRLHNSVNKDFIFQLDSFGSSPAIKTIARFSNLNTQINDSCLKLTKEIESINSNIIFAEVCYLPEGKLGNVILRPAYHQYEIPLLTPSKQDNENQIHLSDLYIYMESNEIRLFSKRLNRRIIPRITNAHNFFSKSLKIYKFLGLIQSQSFSYPNFTVDNLSSFYNYIPRVTIEDIIVSPETWFISVQGIKDIRTQSEECFLSDINIFIDKYKLKSIIIFGVRDNKLPFYLTNLNWFLLLKKEIIKGNLEKVVFTEYVNFCEETIHKMWLEKEVVIPMINQSQVYNGRSNFTELFDEKNRFHPHDDWVTIKIFGGKKSLDNLLNRIIGPTLNNLKANGSISKWFFIRYNVPSWHIRIRINLSSIRFDFLSFKELLKGSKVNKIEYCTYVREMERYGGSLFIEEAESLFCSDSEDYVNFVNSTSLQPKERWKISLGVIDGVLTSCINDKDNKLRYVKKVRDSLALRYENKSFTRKGIGKFYKDKSVFDYLVHININDFSIKKYTLLIKRMSKNPESLTSNLDIIISSLIHMHINRMMIDAGPEIEYVIYDILYRYYAARNNRKG
jgi:thiopeptide-type bacteriocin biosynthesis protein